MKPLSHLRKADASRGDDVALARFVKNGPRAGRPPAPMTAQATTTRFPGQIIAPSRTAVSPSTKTQVLTSGHNVYKLGKEVRIGPKKGMYIYALTLPERETCPSSCVLWERCYGNAMPLARRVDHTDTQFLPLLAAEIARLLAVRGRTGILVRLHELGDFYSTGYVDFWAHLLWKHPRLHVFGFTARPPDGAIGKRVAAMNERFGDRCVIRFSNRRDAHPAAMFIKTADDLPEGAFLCPERMDRKDKAGRYIICATCAACWSRTSRVPAFVEH